ncbi:MAG: DUF3298 and DUF4163 domain-containing protein [Acidobacteriota bacterium]
MKITFGSVKTLVTLAGFSLLYCALTACHSDKPTQLGISQPSSPAASPTATELPATIAPLSNRFNRVLVGTIDGKHAIQMDLGRNDESLFGRYFYAKSADRKYLDLSGQIDASGKAELTEMSGDKETGFFTGKLVNEVRGETSTLKFTGTWAKAKGAQEMTVTLTEKVFDLGGPKLTTKEQKEENKKQKLSIEVAYPQLTGPQLAGSSDANAEKFNTTISEMIAKQVKGFKNDNKESLKEAAESADADRPGNSLDISYTVAHADKNLISLHFSNYSYTGGAHGNTASVTYNYDLNRGVMLKLADLFPPNSNYLKIISDYCLAALKKRDLGDDEQIRGGAGPKADNYGSWNITPDGLQITFDAYQVAAYAAGPQEVVVPYSVLKPIIKPDGPLAAFVK